MFAALRRLFNRQSSGGQKSERLELEVSESQPEEQEPQSQSPQKPRKLGLHFTEPPSPDSASRSRSRSRSPTLSAYSPPVSPVRRRRSSVATRRSSVATCKRLSSSRSPPIQRRRSFAARRSVAAKHRQSFPHRDFANPEAETCWLSCLFQALWHSAVFHAAFEQDLAPEKYAAGPDETLLAALQQTWSEYKVERQDHTQDDAVQGGHGGTDALVPADGLVGGFGEGYGDMSDALACLQSELSDSGNMAAIALSERMVLLPLASMDGSLPTPLMAWQQAVEWQVCGASLIAVDITAPQLAREGIESLARLWVPNGEQPAEGSLGGSHKLVALVCYMWHLQHYVAFCCRQSNQARCCFFNDLPELTGGVPKEVEWQRVPEVCAQYSLTPRLALYESNAMQ